MKNANHYGYGKAKHKKHHSHHGHHQAKAKSCKKDDAKFCDYAFIKKHHKKGYKNFKFKFIDADDAKYDDIKGNYILVATSQHSFIRSINRTAGRIIVCGARVHEIKHSHGHIGLVKSHVEDIKNHNGHLEIDKHSEIKRINNSRCTVSKR